MELIITLLTGIAIGAAAGAAVTWFMAKGLHENDRLRLVQAETAFQKQLAQAEDNCRQQLAQAEESHRRLDEERKQMHQQAMEAQQERFLTLLEKTKAEMHAATDDMLRQRQKEFAESSQTGLGQIVTPLRETIDRMKQAMNDNTREQTSMSAAMRANIENLMRQSEAARRTTEELANVFKRSPKVQGDWGETVLSELLDSQGLTRGIHYDTQVVVRGAEGDQMRPDVILHLDQRREVIVDSKVSLTAFMDYVNAKEPDERQALLHRHIESLRNHVRTLARKDYSSYIQPPKVRMDYVIMFVPHTGALWTALNAQPDLWRRAMDQNVFIADEQTLFAALRIINLTWTQIAQAQNHEKVYALANEMLDRVGQFMKRYQAIGRALQTAADAYEAGEKKLQPTGQSILQTCTKLQRLGAKQSEKNPLSQFIDADAIPAVGTPLEENSEEAERDVRHTELTLKKT